jgi:hypothetical protein
MQRTLFRVSLVAVLIGWLGFSCPAVALDLQMLGLRGGISDHRNDEDFRQYEAFAIWNLAWAWNLGPDWSLATYLEANAGLLNGGGDAGFVGSIGPGLYFSGLKDNVRIYLGVNPTIISEHEYGEEDLGGPFQFTSHIGIGVRFTRHIAIGYRWQHMSNLVFYDENPGLNLHMIEVGYSF